MSQVGKREFTLHTSDYLRRVESKGEELVITHQGEPRLKLIPFRPRTVRDLRGLVSRCEGIEEINKPVLAGYDQWSSGKIKEFYKWTFW